MLKLNVKRLMDNISETESYSPDIGENFGVKYLYEKFYIVAGLVLRRTKR